MGPPGQVATLILPADVSWGEGGVPGCQCLKIVAPGNRPTTRWWPPLPRRCKARARRPFLLGGRALREPALMAVARIAATDRRHSSLPKCFPTRIERGAGLPPVERIAYLAELASVQLTGLDHLILVDAKAPVSFFAYPGKKSYLVPDGCELHTLASFTQDVTGSLDKLAKAVECGSDCKPMLQAP
jgi:acetolactate synthase-1/2/3 large subunit